MKFVNWLDVFMEEKGIDLEECFELPSKEWGTAYLSYEVVIENIKIANPEEQSEIKRMLVAIDFKNGDVKHFLRHLAKALT